jgi:precorrin-6A/cobalt-precorrin-6A reductase
MTARKVLILGGTREGRQLAERLSHDARFAFLLSYAGRTENPQIPDVPHRVGGFGGAQGLARFLERERFDALIDATHPFAARISANAVHACAQAGIPMVRVVRPAWRPVDGDRWTLVPDMEAAAGALGSEPRRVLLTIGRLEIAAFRCAPQHAYLVRAVDDFDPGLPKASVIAARGPFSLDDERRLLRDAQVDVLVSKNAGTDATYPKLIAARELGLPVVMVERPHVPDASEVGTIERALAWLTRLHEGALSARGE